MQYVIVTRPFPHVLLVALNRPHKRNALNTSMLVELAGVLNEAATDREVRCVVLTGDDRAFCAGADIKEMRDGGIDVLTNPTRTKAWRSVEEFPKPLIAAVNGVALGGGNELAMLADIIVAGEGARFGQPEVSVGGMPGDGGTQRLVRIVGKPMAMRMILTGEIIDARVAYDFGLVAQVLPDGGVVGRALEMARAVAQGAPGAAELAKKAVLQASETLLKDGLEFERKSAQKIASTGDREEGLKAFLEKRPPHFTGS